MTEITTPTYDKVTLREFKMWLKGLLDSNDDHRSLPSLDQWRRVLAMIDRIEDHSRNHVVSEPASATPMPIPQQVYGYLNSPYVTKTIPGPSFCGTSYTLGNPQNALYQGIQGVQGMIQDPGFLITSTKTKI